jgi:hypothetical protein
VHAINLRLQEKGIIGLMGPTLTFDKSFLQSLNPDEATWLDNFFSCNITPLFFIETLADIEKEVHKGRTPEQVVGSLAYKTPDMNAQMNPFHLSLLESELGSASTIGMDGRIVKAGGQVVALNDQQGIIYKESKEEEALNRWHHGEFLDLERQIAKAWRTTVSGMDHSQLYAAFQNLYRAARKPKDLPEAKRLADFLVDFDQEKSLRLGMSLLRIAPAAQDQIVQRWSAAGKPALQEFVPYFRHVFSVDLFFYLALAADLISRVRPVGKADNMVDIAYLYYLPFCRVFTSSDNLHERVVPLFLRDDQSFVKGLELKVDLRKLDEHYSALPEDMKAKGFFAFAPDPPEDTSFLVTRLWDKHQPQWRKLKAERKELSPDLQKALLNLMKKITKESQPQNDESAHPKSIEDVGYVHMERQILRKKGKWMRVHPDDK